MALKTVPPSRGRGDADGATALHDGLVEQPASSGHPHEGRDVRAAGRFPGDGDVVRITPEGGDLFLDPLQVP